MINTDDLNEIDLFLDACRRHYLGRPAEPGEARSQIARPGTDPTRDIAVIRDGGAVIGFASIWLTGVEARCFARVHPHATGRGIGGTLLATMEARARELLRGETNRTGKELEMTVTSWATDEAAPGLLRSRGFTEARFFLRMEGELNDLDSSSDDPPVGITIRAYDPARDVEQILTAWREAFADHWGQDDVSAAQWWHDRPSPTEGSRRWLVADHAGQIIGFCLAATGEDRSDVGYIGDIGVLPAWRGRGLGATLLRRMFAVFREQGRSTAALHIDTQNLTGALRLYRKVGMQPRPNFTIWSKLLD